MTQNGEKITQSHKFRNFIWSVVFAIGIWLTIVYIHDPSITMRMNDLPVRYEGEKLIRENMLTLVDKSSLPAVSAVISGKRSDLMEFMDKVNVVVDVSEITSEGEYTLAASVSLPTSKLTVERTSTDSLKVSVKRLETKTIPIRTIQTGTNKDFIVKSVPADTTAIITGSRDELSKVAYGAVTVDISGIVQDYTENNAKYLMYGEDSNLVTKSETITSNLAYTQVSNVVYKKTVLPVKTVLSSDMASLYVLDKAKTLLSSKEIVAGVSPEFNGEYIEYIIDRYTNEEEVFSYKTQSGLYIPDDANITIKPVMEKKTVKEMTFEVGAVNIPEGLSAAYNTQLSVNMECGESAQNSEITASIDLSEYTSSGVFDVPVSFEGGCINDPKKSIEVTLTDK